MKRVIFVCLGNICRSPAAEGIFKKFISDHGMIDDVFVDSAGTSGHHSGSRADARMSGHASKRGFDLQSISRKFILDDLKTFDYIVAMDRNNYWDIVGMTQNQDLRDKVVMMTDYCREFTDVKEIPDPYYGGDQGFEHVLDLLEDACNGLIEHLKEMK